MNRYTKVFEKLKGDSQIAFVPFWMIGDPNLAESKEVIMNLAKTADILELGIPFSDPLADGPVIQEAVNRALTAGSTTQKCLDIVKDVRDEYPHKPIGLLVYFNLIISYGVEEFFAECARIGVDSVLIPELPVEEASSKIGSDKSLFELSKEYGVHLIFLLSSNTPKDRREQIYKVSSGFIYAVSTPTVTGSDVDIQRDTAGFIKLLKQETDIPICVGFGVSTKDDVQALANIGADGAIIGSELIRRYQKGGLDPVLKLCKKCHCTSTVG